MKYALQKKLVTLAVLCVSAMAMSNAWAADVKVATLPYSSVPVILLKGEIKSGDDEKFRVIALANKQALVSLDSDGGALNTALEIGRIIRLREFSTFINSDSSCASACALIWLSGEHRTLIDGGRVGFHASYVDVDGSPIQTSTGNALVGHYLSQLGFGDKTVIFATAAPPDKILWLDSQTSNISGIDYSRQSPSDLPVVSRNDISSNSSNETSSTKYVANISPQISNNVMFFVNGLQKSGYKAELDNQSTDTPSIITGLNGDKFLINFSGCEKLNCKYIEMCAFWSGINQLNGSIAIQNNSSEENFAGAIYVRGDQELLVYHYIVAGTEGISLQNLIDNMNYFVKDFDRIGKLIPTK